VSTEPEPEPTSDAPLDEAGKRRALLTVAFTLFLDLAGFGIILPILPIYALDMNASPAQVALLSTAFSAAQFLMAPVLGRISDRYGRRPVMLFSIAGSAAAALVLGFAGALWVVFAARMVSGASKANVSTAHACVADLVPKDERAKYMGRMGAAMGMGFIFGPVIGGIVSGLFDHHVAFFLSAGLSILNFGMAALWLPETRRFDLASSSPPARKNLLSPAGMRQALRGIKGTHMAWLVLIAFFFSLSFAGMESTLALFGEALFSWTSLEIGLFMAFIGVSMVVFQGLIVGRAVARIGEAKTLALGLGLLAIGLLALGGVEQISLIIGFEAVTPEGGATPTTLVFFAVGGACMAGGNGLSMATLSALVSRVSTVDEQGWNMGLKESASSLSRVFGPVGAGLLFQHIDPGAPMIVGGLVAIGSCQLALFLGRRMHRDTPHS